MSQAEKGTVCPVVLKTDFPILVTKMPNVPERAPGKKSSFAFYRSKGTHQKARSSGRKARVRRAVSTLWSKKLAVLGEWVSQTLISPPLSNTLSLPLTIRQIFRSVSVCPAALRGFGQALGPNLGIKGGL